MFSFLDRLGRPVKYSLVGALGGYIANFILIQAGMSPPNPLATIVGLAVGGFIGGLISQRRGGGKG